MRNIIYLTYKYNNPNIYSYDIQCIMVGNTQIF